MKINFESSTSCNARCVFCPRYEMTRPMGEMSDELFRKIIKEGKEMGIKKYSPFMNGEPFVFSRIWEWLDYMEGEDVQIALYTNAERVDVDRIKKYHNIWYINCSINAVTEETYNRVMRGPNFATSISNARRMIDECPFFVRASFVKCDENIHEEAEFRKLFGRRAKICGFANWTGDRDALVARKGKRIPCNVIMNQMFILWDGRVVPCCMDYNAKMVVGDITNESIKDVWNRLGEMRRRHRNYDFNFDVCSRCNYNVNNLT